MRAPEQSRLAQELRAAGAAPVVIARMLEELRDHCADAESAARARGLTAAEARRVAVELLGPTSAIVAAVAERRDLLDWRHRWPQSARCVDRLGNCLFAPAAPLYYCAAHPADLIRWGLSSGLALCVTASMLLGLHWLII